MRLEENLNFCDSHYNPGTGRFLSEDPIGFESGDLNLYRYVGNMPLIATDPTGLVAFCTRTAFPDVITCFKRLSSGERRFVTFSYPQATFKLVGTVSDAVFDAAFKAQSGGTFNPEPDNSCI